MTQKEYFASMAKAIKIYYELKAKPAEQLTFHDRLHLQNMEYFAECQQIEL